jgi:hypothetical protein
VSFSVAAKTWPKASSGCAYWAASSGTAQACLSESSDGLEKPTPKRPELPRKVGQGASTVTMLGAGAGVAVAEARDDGDILGFWAEGLPQVAAEIRTRPATTAPVSRSAARASTRNPPAGRPRPR